jgi:putative lipoprotein
MILILATSLAAQGCTSAADVAALRDRQWTLTWVEGFPSLPSGVSTPTVSFGSDGRLSGNTGCNSAGAAYTAEGDGLTIQAVMSTKRACLNPEGNQLERAYLSALERTRRFRITNGELELLDASDRVLARFAPAR